MPRLGTWAAALLVLAMSSTAHSGILNFRGGVGTVVERDRDTRDSTRYTALLLAASYRTPVLEFALDLPLRWETRTREFDRGVWEREGDWLRPLQTLKYSSSSGAVGGGMEIFTNWTPGDGLLVRGLSGRGEPDYVLPGFRFTWSGDQFDLDAGIDRAVDPTVLAAAFTYRPFDWFRLVVEGAADPEAPLLFTGDSEGGRPAADDSERLSANAAGVFVDVVDGRVLDIGVGAHAAEMNGESRGIGPEFSATLDFTGLYLNRLSLKVRSMTCGGGYIPAWFDGPYPVQRWGPGGQPLLALNPLDPGLPDRKMRSYMIRYDLGDFFSIDAGLDSFTDDSMRRARFGAQLREENGRGLDLSIWSRADDPDIKLFSADSTLHTRAGALYNILPHFVLNVAYQHSWAYHEAEAGFVPLNSILIGVMYDISL